MGLRDGVKDKNCRQICMTFSCFPLPRLALQREIWLMRRSLLAGARQCAG